MAFVGYNTIEPVDICEKEYFATGITSLDRWVIGVPKAGVTIISGLAGCGKSTLLGKLICEFSSQHLYGLVCSLEMKNSKLQAWLNNQVLGKNFIECETTNSGKEIWSPKRREFQNKAQDFLDKYIKVYDNKDFTIKNIMADIKSELNNARPLDYIIIDNLMKIDYDETETDKYSEQSVLVKEFQILAQETGIAIIVVAHPKKIKTLLRRDDISGSGDIVNVADLVLIMHKITDDFKIKAFEYWNWNPKDALVYQKGYDTLIEIVKSRDFGEAEGKIIGQFYDLGSRRILNYKTENINYIERDKEKYQ